MRFYLQKIFDSFVGVGNWAVLFVQTVWVSFKRPPFMAVDFRSAL